MHLIILLFICSCGSFSQYNIEHISEKYPKKISLNLNLGVEILAKELEKNELMSAYAAKELIAHGFFTIETKQIPFDCHGTPAVVCLSGNTITLGVKPEFNGCISKTAYLHQLTHFLLCQRLKFNGEMDCDSEHLMSDWWRVTDLIASPKFEEKECPRDEEHLDRMFIDWRIDWKKYPEVIVYPKDIWK